MSRRNFVVMAGAAAALLGIAGVAFAQQRVVLYTSNEATLNKLIASEFQKATGIEVNVISAGSGVIVKRIQTEKERPQAGPKGFVAPNPPAVTVHYLIGAKAPDAVEITAAPAGAKGRGLGVVMQRPGPGLGQVAIDLRPGEYTITLKAGEKAAPGESDLVITGRTSADGPRQVPHAAPPITLRISKP